MLKNGLTVCYDYGENSVSISEDGLGQKFAVGELPCKILQHEVVEEISRVFFNCIRNYPRHGENFSQEEVEIAERYVLSALSFCDFIPAQHLAQGSFIRNMEWYRALDPESANRLLIAELERAKDTDFLLTDIGFENMGRFLNLCFNDYIIDLSNAIELFTVFSATETGTASREEQDLFKELCEGLAVDGKVPGIEMRMGYDLAKGNYTSSYVINSFLAFVVFEFSHYQDSPKRVMRCQNPECGCFFMASRSTAKYCDFPSPQKPSQTCKVFYPQHTYREKEKADYLGHLEKNACCRLYVDRSRHPEAYDEISKLIRNLRTYSFEKKKEVMEGRMAKSEYQQWLDSFQRNK